MDLLHNISLALNEAAASNNADAFANLATNLKQSKDQVREELQALTAEKIKAIIQKLEKNQSLNPDEKDYVKLWVVGDAEGYTKLEDSLKERQEEFRRLVEVIKDYEPKVLSLQDLVNLHGILEDAVKTATAVAHFLDDKERIARFEKAINNLDAADNNLIADILRGSLVSNDM
jgi:hypothetical protein